MAEQHPTASATTVKHNQLIEESGYPNLDTIQAQTLTQLLEDSIDWAHACGMVMRTAQDRNRSDICQTAPFTLLPSPFPRKLFQEAMQIQQTVNLLYFRASWDYDFLIDTHAEVVKTDDFTRHMINILEEVRRSGVQQKRTLLIQRNDYMCQADSDGYKLRQIEVNNIAASMGSLAERASSLHKRVLRTLKVPNETIKKASPDNRAIDTIANGIFEAWSDFGDHSAIVLFIVEDENQNQIDQRHVEYRLDEICGGCIEMKRITLTNAAKRLYVQEGTGNLLIDNSLRVAVVYFRAAYAPDNYPTEFEWDARRVIELSNAIKCPSIGLQLANTKKVQQVLASKGGVERFVSDSEMCRRIRDTFAGIWGLEKSSRNECILQDAIAHPEIYVLKPQLEGGHGNYYGKEVAEKLKTMSDDELAAHILMERIRPMVVKNFLIRPLTSPIFTDVVSELGIYAYLYGSPENESMISNRVGGHIIRTKGENVDKGGVAIGAAFIDSPFLF